MANSRMKIYFKYDWWVLPFIKVMGVYYKAQKFVGIKIDTQKVTESVMSKAKHGIKIKCSAKGKWKTATNG
jgi:hypothetical protein